MTPADVGGSGDAIVVTRLIDAPVAVVWRMWTIPEHVRAWYGPGGASVPVAEMDVRVGGVRRVCMEMPTPRGPRRMWFTGEYRAVEEGTLLVYTEAMCDEDGRPLSAAEAGLPPGHPATTEVRVELEDLDGRTRVVVTHSGMPAGSGAAAGWAAALDALAGHAASTGDRT